MRRDLAFWSSAVVLALIVIASVLAERIAPFGPNEQDITQRLRPPAWQGTSSAPTRSAATS